MPYSKISDLPENLNVLPSHAKEIFMAAFNSALEQYKDENRARRVAWSAVKNSYKKNEDGEWVKKSEEAENSIGYADMYFTKSTVSADGEMRWSATASDIYPDVFNERMSLDLYRSFIDNFNAGKPMKVYVSLSHYPSLNGRGEAGHVTHLYIDGDKLKAKGVFSDTRLGRAIFESIKRDRIEKVDPNKRVRVSIGFYALKYRVGDKEWTYGNGQPLLRAATGEVKVYLSGLLEHLAVTRSPANLRANIKAYHKEDMVEKSEMPLTRADDALSVVGPENADLVEDFENEVQKQPIQRSHAPLVEKYDISADLLLVDILNKIKGAVALMASEEQHLLRVLYADGSLGDDEMSQRLGYLLSNITSRSEVAKEQTVTEEIKETELEVKKDDMEEVEDEVENEAPDVYKPFGGATSIEDALKVIEAERMADKMYRAYSVLGAVTGNILTSELSPEEKMSAMSDCLDKAKSLFTSEELVKLSVVDRDSSIPEPVVEVTSEGDGVKEQKLWTPLLDRVDEVLANAVNLSTTERRDGLQALINEFANGLTAIDLEIEKSQAVQKSGIVQPETTNSNTITQDVLANVLGQLSAQLDARFEARMAETNNQISALANQLGQIATALNGNVVARTVVQTPAPQQFQQPVINQQQVPVAKSINYATAQDAVNQGGFNGEKKSSIRDIVSRTTFIPR